MKRRTILIGFGGLGATGLGAVAFRRDGSEPDDDPDDGEPTEQQPDGSEPSPSPEGENSEKPPKETDEKKGVRLYGKPSFDRINPNSRYVFDDAYQIVNHGKRPASVWLEVHGRKKNDNDELTILFHPDREYDESLVGRDNAVKLEGGEQLPVSVTIDTTGVGAGASLVEKIGVRSEPKL